MRPIFRPVLIAFLCSGLGCSTPQTAPEPAQPALLDPAASDIPYDVQVRDRCPDESRPSDGDSSRVSWWLQPKHGFQGEGKVVGEDGRVLGTVDRQHQQLRQGGELDPEHTRISVRVYDEAGRVIGEWLFRDADLGEAAATPEELRADIAYHANDDVWRYTGDDARLERVWLGQYHEDSQRVLREVRWRNLIEPLVPGVDSTFSRLGTDEPHEIRRFGRAYTAAVSMPDAWHGKLQMVVLRKVDGQGRMTQYAEYRNRWHEDAEMQRLTLERWLSRKWGAGGILIREARDDRSRGRDPNLADGIIDSVSELEVEDGRIVEARTQQIGFDPDVPWARVPPTWRSVEVEPDGEDEGVEPRSIISSRALYVRDEAGNLREQRGERRRTTVLYGYDEQGRLTWSGQDGQARPGQLAKVSNRYQGRKIDGAFDRTIRYEYDVDGRRTSKVMTKYERGIQTRRYVTAYRYEEGRLVGERRSSRSPSRPDFEGRARVVEYQYDDAGRLLIRVEGWEGAEHPFSTTLYEYDKAGRLSRTTDLGSGRHDLEDFAGELEMFSERREYTYDDRGRRVEERLYRRGREKASRRTEYVYGEGEQPVKALYFKGERKRGTFDWDVTFWFVTQYKYDQQGRLVREIDAEAPRVVRYRDACFEGNEGDAGTSKR
ncbi:MAG: RHS repeat domain-containing protein [Myxococcota bacterium]